MGEIDYGTPFAYLFRQKGGWTVLLIGVVLLFFSWLVVPLLVVLGYAAELGRTVAMGSGELPRFRLRQAVDGLKAIVVMIGYLLPTVLIFVPVVVLGGAFDEEAPGAAFALFFLGNMAIALYALGVSLLQPAIFAVFIARGRIGACFQPQLIKAVINPRSWSYLAVAALLIGVSQLVWVGVLVFLVGLLFAAFYYLLIYAHYAGQLARPLMLQTSGGVQL